MEEGGGEDDVALAGGQLHLLAGHLSSPEAGEATRPLLPSCRPPLAMVPEEGEVPEGGAEGGQRGNLHLPDLGQGEGHECSSVPLEDRPEVAADRDAALAGLITHLQLDQLLEVQQGEQGVLEAGLGGKVEVSQAGTGRHTGYQL